MMLHRLSGGEDIKNRREEVLEAAKLILEVSGLGNKTLAEEKKQFLRSIKLRFGAYEKYPQNSQNCDGVI